MHASKLPRRERGFTLLEVVVAFALVVLTLSAIYEAIVLSARTMHRAELKARALLLAESRLAELGTLSPLAMGVQDERRDDGTAVRVEVRAVEPRQIDAEAPAPWVDVIVQATPASDPRAAVTLTTRRPGPAP